MSLDNYWPSLDEINNCIKDQAENSSDEVLLAVHQEFPLAYSIVGKDGNVMQATKQHASEDEFLKYFLKEAPAGFHTVPITGQSGVGKSHLIRVLDARLKRLRNADKYLVIRIPKSASLRKVVELILSAEPLQDKTYDSVKSEFSKATADISIEEAVISFGATLEIALGQYEKTLREEFDQKPTELELKLKIGHCRDLPALLTDAEFVQHFRENVYPRIIQRTVKGGNLDDQDVDFDPNSRKFGIADFDFESRNIKIEDANLRVQRYVTNNINNSNPRSRNLAIEVLNDVVDDATNQQYNLNQSMGGMTLSEVILDIRRLLLKDKRELVLLIEDFAALIGIQDTLGKILIQEGVTNNRTEYATIRSAIAVTDGYLGGRNTYATRAGQEWVVESRLESEEEALSRTKKLVASYLNAARWGENDLMTHYNNPHDEQSFDAPLYIEDIGDSMSSLEAFGTEGDIPLFPFSSRAIEFLARHSSDLSSGNNLIFNPRYIIKNVIRPILERRDSFLKNQFPPPGMRKVNPSAAIQLWISRLELSDDLRGRYERLVTVWGNDPKSAEEINNSISKEIFLTFGLKVPEGVSPNEPKPSPGPTPPSPTPSPAPSPSPVDTGIATKIQSQHETLEQWNKGTRLVQELSSIIRTYIKDQINNKIDWTAERINYNQEDYKFKITDIYIHNAVSSTEREDPPQIKLVQDPTTLDPDGTLRIQLFALLRNNLYVKDKIAEYPYLDEDLANIANLIDRLIPQALEIIRAKTRKGIGLIIHALSLQNRALGLIEAKPPHQYKTLFSNIEVEDNLPDYAYKQMSEWVSLKAETLAHREILQTSLSDKVGAFQGGDGKTCFALDIVKIIDSFPDMNIEIDFNNWPSDHQDSKNNVRALRTGSIQGKIEKTAKDVQRIVTSIDSEFGEKFNKNEIAKTMTQLANRLKEDGIYSQADVGVSFPEFVTLSDEFSGTLIEKSISTFTKFNAGDLDENARISSFGRMQLTPFSLCSRFISLSLQLIEAAEKQVKFVESQSGGFNKTAKIKEIKRSFNELNESLKVIEEDTKNGHT